MSIDGPVHFSDLKQFAKSPAHFFHSATRVRETTRPMRVGSLVDLALLTDKKPLVYEGDRRGKAWDAFKDAHPGEDLYTSAEADDAASTIMAARLDPMAREYLGLDDPTRRTQVPLKWRVNGIDRETRGVDVIVGNRMADMKITNTTKPGLFAWHARKMLWHCQLADYEEACKQNGIDVSGGLYLCGIEATMPHCTTVLRLTPNAIEEARRCLAAWHESYKICRDSDQWPGYVQCPVDLDCEVFGAGDDDEGEEVAA